MTAACRRGLAALLLLLLPQQRAVAAADLAGAELAGDDECAAAGGEGCAVSAMQLRARARGVARAAAAAAAPRDEPAEALAWERCGGEGWKGPTACEAGTKCAEVDEFFSQCKPDGTQVPESQKKKDAAQAASQAGASVEADPAVQEPLTAQGPLPKAPKVATMNPIVIKGNFLYDSVTGKRFFAKGVAYNAKNEKFDSHKIKKGNCTGGKPKMQELAYDADPTTDEYEPVWKEALNAIANMGANTVRLYNIDPAQSHDKFMATAASLGLYVIIPLTRHDWGYLPAFPAPRCYTEVIDSYGNVGTNLLISAKLIVKTFSKYNNTLLFTVANEMTVNDKNGYAAFPCVKALTRDIHRYQSECSSSMRRIPLLYADMDMGPPFRITVGKYLTCELESPDDVVDVYGLNVYSWCDSKYLDETGKDNFQYSPYYPITQEFKNFPVPLIFAEFGCNTGEFETHCPYEGGRTWPDIKTFFTQFKEIMSGAIAFEFAMQADESQQFGLALTPGFTSDPHNKDRFYYLDAYFALKKQFEHHNVSSDWDGAVAADCAWTPDKAHKLSFKHTASTCPSMSEVEKVFRDKGLDSKANWLEKLPAKPEGVDADELANCTIDEVAPDLYAEGCCHMKCEK